VCDLQTSKDKAALVSVGLSRQMEIKIKIRCIRSSAKLMWFSAHPRDTTEGFVFKVRIKICELPVSVVQNKKGHAKWKTALFTDVSVYRINFVLLGGVTP
jgi:hypothetical protein